MNAHTGFEAFLRKSTSLLVGFVLAVAVAGCASFTNKTKPNDDFAEADPPDLLYNQGLAYLSAGDTTKAGEKFKKIDEEHPYSEYARRSMIMTAYLSFRRGQYPETINAARRYVTLFPASEDAAYAQYMIGESYFRQIPDVTRDQKSAAQAIQAMNQVIVKYPDSEYAIDARKKIQIAQDQIAGKEVQIGRYYQERREFLASINRFRVVVEKYQSTRHVEEALHRLTECYLALGIVQEAQTSAAVLGHNFPDSSWYQDSYNLLNKGGVEPKENRGSWISRAFRRGA